MQRVRIGVTGLAVVFLLVLLAAALLGMLRRESAQRSAQVAAGPGVLVNGSTVEVPKEPLAELGVAPGSGPSTTPATTSSATGTVATAPAAQRGPAPSGK